MQTRNSQASTGAAANGTGQRGSAHIKKKYKTPKLTTYGSLTDQTPVTFLTPLPNFNSRHNRRAR